MSDHALEEQISLPTRALVLSTVGTDGALHAEPIFVMSALLGHSDKAVRDCLARLAGEGLLVHDAGRGRGASYRVTAAGRAAIESDIGWAAYAHRVDSGLEPWDGWWHLTAFEVPERRRAARDALRRLLIELGAAPIQSGLYVHPHDLFDLVSQLAEHLEVPDAVRSFVTPSIRTGLVAAQGAEPTDDDPAEFARRIWPLDELADRYGVLELRLAAIEADADRLGGEELAAVMFAAAAETEAVHRDDPLLPTQALPDDWAGSRARQAFMAAHAAASAYSELYRNSHSMSSFVAEIVRSLDETSEQFWQRWWPRFLDAYRAKLPPAATGESRQS